MNKFLSCYVKKIETGKKILLQKAKIVIHEGEQKKYIKRTLCVFNNFFCISLEFTEGNIGQVWRLTVSLKRMWLWRRQAYSQPSLPAKHLNKSISWHDRMEDI